MPFVRALTLEADVMREGWNRTTAWWRPQRDQQECFYTPSESCSCAALHAGDCGNHVDASTHRAHASGKQTRGKTNTNAEGRLGEFYTLELAEKVLQWAALDFTTFGYSRDLSRWVKR